MVQGTSSERASADAALALVLDLAAAARTHELPTVLELGAVGLAGVLRVEVALYLRPADLDALNQVPALRMLATSDGLDRAAALGQPLPPHVVTAMLGAVPVQGGAPRVVALDGRRALGVALRGYGVLLLCGPGAASLTPVQHRVAVEVSAMLGRLLHEGAVRDQEVQQLATAHALRSLLQAGVQACSSMEAAQALATTTATALGVDVACTYLVGADGLICEIATAGASPDRDARLRNRLLGAPADGSPVWRRAAAGLQPGPDLIPDTSEPGVVRPGGVAEILALQSMATIPLLSSDGPLGLVLCGDSRGARRWKPSDRDLLGQLALQGTVVVDNARLRQAERFEARFDSLTGLANRRAFNDRLRSGLETSRRSGEGLAVLQVDLDRFKEVNDRLGHHLGDQLLIGVARRLTGTLTDAALVARLGGDEFVVLLQGPVDPAAATDAAERISSALDRPFPLGDHEVTIEASVGVAVAPDHGEEAELLLQRADRAMYAAKRSGLSHELYREEHDADAGFELGLLGELRRALVEDQLVLHYQPKIELRTGRVVGVEALVRWDHPRLGLLGPDRFVPLAEQSGRIRALTGWVLPHALEQASRWREQGIDLTIAVNVSPHDLTDPLLPQRVSGWLEQSGHPGERLVVEVTEGTLMADRVAASAVLQRLRALGVQVSLDDFGTGYSSLAYLHTLPVDEIKIDRSFLTDGLQHHVVRSIVALASDLGLRTVVEGVEDGPTAVALAEMGCEQAQGFYYCRPVPAAVLAARLRPDGTLGG